MAAITAAARSPWLVGRLRVSVQLHPLRTFGLGLPRLPPIVQAVRGDASECLPGQERCHELANPLDRRPGPSRRGRPGIQRPGDLVQVHAEAESLKALGLEKHQALIVAHRDGHPHVHVIVNRVDARAGRRRG